MVGGGYMYTMYWELWSAVAYTHTPVQKFVSVDCLLSADRLMLPNRCVRGARWHVYANALCKGSSTCVSYSIDYKSMPMNPSYHRPYRKNTRQRWRSQLPLESQQSWQTCSTIHQLRHHCRRLNLLGGGTISSGTRLSRRLTQQSDIEYNSTYLCCQLIHHT
jgi:hypothetical protein